MSAIRPAIRSALQPAIRSAFASSGATAWTPLTLFANSEVGVWYDPSDFSTMFQTSTGTTPVTAVGDPVGLILDKSDGLVIGSELVMAPYSVTGSGLWSGTSTSVTRNGSTTGQASLAVSGILASTKFYRITFTVADLSGDTFYMRAGSGAGTNQITANGTYSFTTIGGGSNAVLFAPWGGVAGQATITNISVKELAGNHAYQATAASRPILGRTPVGGRRNLLTYTEQFDNAQWVKQAGSISANSTTAPDGTTTADTFVEDATGVGHYVTYALTPALAAGAGSYVLGAYFKQAPGATRYGRISANGDWGGNSANVNLSTGAVTNVVGAGTWTATSVGGGWWRFSCAFTATGGNTGTIFITMSDSPTGGATYTGDGTSGVYIWGAQLETGSAATAYQKVVQAYDVTESGKADCYGLYFDGADDSLATAAIDFTATDAVGVFAGIRKSSDAARGTIVELTASAAANNGAFHLAAPNAASATIAFESKGTVLADAVASTGVAAPLSAVLTGTSDISGDSAILRVNGAQADADTGDQGTGNFANAAMYIGRRGGASLPFKGFLHSLTVLGRTATAAEITSAESYAAGKVGISI